MVRSHFELARFFVRALNRSDVPVVSCHFVAGAKRERGFQVRFFGIPIDAVGELDAIAGISGRQAHDLNKFRALGFALHPESDSCWTVFYHADLR